MTSYGIERVVLLDDEGRDIGSEDKATVHRRDTPLHLAFSCYVFSVAAELLVTRRATDKLTFPGVWTNTACGHPAPGEGFLDAVRRRTRQELGLCLRDLKVVLPGFRYRAEMSNGMTENEMCPVSAARAGDDSLLVDASEVAETTWVPWLGFRDDVLTGARVVSPWCLEQVRQLAALGDDPSGWPAAAVSDLPPAARAAP
jgi:isopentenyl-diphosphate delta-isomerase